jgi:pimeloyl-ACP methyl ester carboxylesterase
VIEERRIEAGGIETRCLEVEGPRPDHPVLFFHGNPSSADDWRPFLERLEGRRRCLAPDLVGWGLSERPPDFRYSMDSLAWFVERLFMALGLERFDLVMHDWGSIALVAASRWPESVGRMVILNTVPLDAGFRWHWVGRLWRRRRVGELLTATTTRWSTRLLLRQATPRRGGLPELADQIVERMDSGTKRAILELYRDADPHRLGAAGDELFRLTAPALVLWGDDDPYIDRRFAEAFAELLPGATEVEHFAGAGHWPWLDRPEVIDRAAEFLTRDGEAGSA